MCFRGIAVCQGEEYRRDGYSDQQTVRSSIRARLTHVDTLLAVRIACSPVVFIRASHHCCMWQQTMAGEFKERVHESFVIAAREASAFFSTWIKDNADNDDMAVVPYIHAVSTATW